MIYNYDGCIKTLVHRGLSAHRALIHPDPSAHGGPACSWNASRFADCDGTLLPLPPGGEHVTTTATNPAGVTIRRATRADLLEVHRIEKQSFPQPWPYHAFEEFLVEPGFLVAYDTAVVGYVVGDAIRNHGSAIGHVKDFAVDSDRRGEGIGSRLLERTLGTLATRGVGYVKLEVRASNDGALSLYRRFGFEHHHTVPRYYDDGEDALVMVADLAER
jgi:ribosomal-protein-alanine N-acetyltransferase